MTANLEQQCRVWTEGECAQHALRVCMCVHARVHTPFACLLGGKAMSPSAEPTPDSEGEAAA